MRYPTSPFGVVSSANGIGQALSAISEVGGWWPPSTVVMSSGALRVAPLTRGHLHLRVMISKGGCQEVRHNVDVDVAAHSQMHLSTSTSCVKFD